MMLLQLKKLDHPRRLSRWKAQRKEPASAVKNFTHGMRALIEKRIRSKRVVPEDSSLKEKLGITNQRMREVRKVLPF